MKNKLLLISVIATLVCGCSKSHKPEDPLLLPPNFNEMPDLTKPTPETPKANPKDAEELRDLLLKNSNNDQ